MTFPWIASRSRTVDVRPFNDDANCYEQPTLSLAAEFGVQGKLSLKDLGNPEITDFDVEDSAPGRITGMLGMLLDCSSYQCALAA